MTFSIDLTNTKEFEKEFFTVGMANPVWREKIFQQLSVVFANATQDTISKYRQNYWRWYVYVTWQNLNHVTADEMIKIIETQVIDALKLGIDVWDKLLWYMELQVVNDEEIKKFFKKIKDTFFASQFEAGKFDGTAITIADLIKKINTMKSQNADSIELAGFMGKIRRAFFTPDEKMPTEYIVIDQDLAVRRFFDLVMYLLEIDLAQIYNIVDNYVNADRSYEPEKEEVKLVPSATPSAPKPKKDIVLEKKLSATQIKSLIESQFKKTPDGQFEDVAAVYDKLAELAEKYNDPKIGEMYYYDERTGRFVWTI